MALAVRKTVEIDGETYSLDVIPTAGSNLVVEAKKNIFDSLDLKALVEDLNKLGSFIRLAYNGVAGNTELQIKVQRVGYKITKLADKSAVTVHSFKTTSRDVLQELQGTYEYLLNGLEEMATVTLSGLAQVAEKMAKAAEELRAEFEAATSDVIDALEDTQRRRGAQVGKKEKMRKEREQFEKENKKAQKLQAEAMEAERKAEQYFNEAQRREDKAFDLQTSVLHQVSESLAQVLQAGISVLSFDPVKIFHKFQEIGDNTYKEVMKKANEEKMTHLEDMQKQRDIRREANQRCIEFADSIKNCTDDESLAQVAIEALHSSVGALKSLSTIMMQVARFWWQMQKHCEQLTGEQLQRAIETAMKLPPQQRIVVWTVKPFKEKAIRYYAKWVALDNICGIYMMQIKETQSDLYSYLQENPTTDQARRNVRTLANKFKTDLEKAQREIVEKDTQACKEIKYLQHKN